MRALSEIVRVNVSENADGGDFGSVLTLVIHGGGVLGDPTLYLVLLQAKKNFAGFLRAHMTKEEKVLVIDDISPSTHTSTPCP